MGKQSKADIPVLHPETNKPLIEKLGLNALLGINQRDWIVTNLEPFIHHPAKFRSRSDTSGFVQTAELDALRTSAPLLVMFFNLLNLSWLSLIPFSPTAREFLVFQEKREEE